MTDPVDFTLDTLDQQRIVTIVPINITLTSGILYSTGQYDINEGAVGLGTITFDVGNDWTYEGFGDISTTEIDRIAEFIKQKDNREKTANGTPPAPAINEAEQKRSTLNFIAQNNGKPVDVHVALTYPVYEVSVAGKPAGQIQQDHHSNWFQTSGRMDDALVQEVGARINQEVAG